MVSRNIKIHPSILSADFMNLEAELEKISNADAVHVDVMDNHFVPNLTLGLPVLEQISRVSSIPVDVHLMIDDPNRWALSYAEAGVGSVTFHYEAVRDPVVLIHQLRRVGVKVGMALSPNTGLDVCLPFLDQLDMLLIMSVEPGFGGQVFLDFVIPKIVQARSFIDLHGLGVDLQVDGGISAANIGQVASFGANVFVAGSAVYGACDVRAAVEDLRSLVFCC